MDGLAFAAQVRARSDTLLRLYKAQQTDADIAIEASEFEGGTIRQQIRLARAEGAIEALTSLRECVTGW